MTRAPRWAAWLLCAACAASPARAGTFPVDDSRSQVLSPLVRMQWVDPVPGRAGNAVQGRLSVIARLDVSPWRGRVGRIYMTLPPQPVDSLRATWTTRGVLMPGAVAIGQRTLVYAGPLTADTIEDTLQLTLVADGDRLFRTEPIAFRFEIDLDTP